VKTIFTLNGEQFNNLLRLCQVLFFNVFYLSNYFLDDMGKLIHGSLFVNNYFADSLPANRFIVLII